VPISTDANSGISTGKSYTHKLDFIADGSPATVNGVAFTAAGTSGSVGGFGWNLTGTPNVISEPPPVAPPATFTDPNGIYKLLSHFYYGTFGPNEVITLPGLPPGTRYELRLYNRLWGGPPARTQTVTFDEDGPGPASTVFVFDQDGMS